LGPLTARTVHPLVPGHRRSPGHPRRHGPLDQIPGPVLGRGQRVPRDRRQRRVLFRFRRGRPTEPSSSGGTRQDAGVAHDPVVLVCREYAVLAGEYRNGNDDERFYFDFSFF